MKTLNISISELEFNKFGFKADSLSFSDLLDVVGKELMRQNLNKSIELAEKYGLSKMSINDINQEVKAVRDKHHEEQQLTTGLQTAMSKSRAFSFLQDDDDIYSVDDLKVPHDE